MRLANNIQVHLNNFKSIQNKFKESSLITSYNSNVNLQNLYLRNTLASNSRIFIFIQDIDNFIVSIIKMDCFFNNLDRSSLIYTENINLLSENSLFLGHNERGCNKKLQEVIQELFPNKSKYEL